MICDTHMGCGGERSTCTLLSNRVGMPHLTGSHQCDCACACGDDAGSNGGVVWNGDVVSCGGDGVWYGDCAAETGTGDEGMY